MKILPYTFLIICLFSTQVQATYDYLSVDIIPTENEVKFCFQSDYSTEDNTYLAAQVGSQFYFLSQDKQLNLWDGRSEPPIFTKKAVTTNPDKGIICFDPFPKTVLQDISVYAGVGKSLDDMIKKERYAVIYSDTADSSKSLKDWTIMVYMIGADLETVNSVTLNKRYGSRDILEMLAGTSVPNSDSFNLIVSTGGSKRYGWSKVKRSVIEKGQQKILQDLGPAKMAESEALKDFVLWSRDNFPAQHYALILWGHGDGRGGYGIDDSEKGKLDLLDLNELSQSFQAIRVQLNQPLDVVVYDACLMGSLEVAEVTATLATAMAASADVEPRDGLDYQSLLSIIASSIPTTGLEFAKIAQNSYLQQTKSTGTYDKSRITYSVLDLTKLPQFTETLEKFAQEFKDVLEKQELWSYGVLSNGIIRAPGYPTKALGKKSLSQQKNLRIDFYNVLQTVGSDFPTFKQYADELLTLLDGKLVVDYFANPNITKINSEAGRISYDVSIDNTEYLKVLPRAYTLLQEGLKYYNQRRQADSFKPDGEKVALACSGGFTCAYAQWLELLASDVSGIEGYFGRKVADHTLVYLIKSLYRQEKTLTEDLKIGVDGMQACQYQICVDDSHCQDITLTTQQDQLVADIDFNGVSAVLSFCRTVENQWLACGVTQQLAGIWGRDEQLSAGDALVPSILQIQGDQLEPIQGASLVVGETPVFLKTNCDAQLASISVSYYGPNQLPQLTDLCNQGDCICTEKEKEKDIGCRELNAKAGVILLH